MLLAAVLLLAPADLSPADARAGWIMLFDGESTFGWTADGPFAVKEGRLTAGGDKAVTLTTTGAFGPGTCRASYRYAGPKGELRKADAIVELTATTDRDINFDAPSKAAPLKISLPAGAKLELARLVYQPRGTKPLFTGKDLSGWKEFPGRKSKFTLTPEGWLNVADGPGDLQTEGQWADFIFQGECVSNGEHLNSGIFFRSLPGQYQMGYEAQIRNEWQGTDRTKPVDFGTGAIYRRQPARKVVSSDRAWFTLTIAATGNHLATWVDGYQVTDWTDTRPDADNARNGCKRGAGCLSIQGHDPTTNLSFRNFRVAEWK